MAERPDILRKVQGLIDKANATSFDAERDAFLGKADSLMAAYAIAQFELDFAKDAKDRSRAPELREYEYGSTGDHDADRQLHEIFYSLCSLSNVLIGWYGVYSSRAVGYREDLEYVDMLMTGIRLHLAVTIEPHPAPELSLEENLAALKEAGLKWQRVYEHLVKVYPDDPHFKQARCASDLTSWHVHGTGCVAVGDQFFQKKMPRPVGVWFTGVYTRYCKANGRDRVYSNPDVWRRNFTAGYVTRVNRRINAMQAAREEAGVGKELVLASMAERLREALYQFFPEKRPHPPGCDCDLHHRCDNPQCQRPRCADARKPVKASRYGARSFSERKVDWAAREAGGRAGDGADLSGGRRNVGGNKGVLG